MDESSATLNAIDADYRVSRLRRTATEETRVSSALSISSRGVVQEDQVDQILLRFSTVFSYRLEISWFN